MSSFAHLLYAGKIAKHCHPVFNLKSKMNTNHKIFIWFGLILLFSSNLFPAVVRSVRAICSTILSAWHPTWWRSKTPSMLKTSSAASCWLRKFTLVTTVRTRLPTDKGGKRRYLLFLPVAEVALTTFHDTFLSPANSSLVQIVFEKA